MHNAHVSEQFRTLHGAVLDIVAVMNGPQRDAMLLNAAGVRLDRALFPLLVNIGKFGPIGVVELGHRNGRDHSTVSRQVAKLEVLGLVHRTSDPEDRRRHAAELTAAGRAMTDRIDMARENLTRATFAHWETAELDTLVRLVRRYADQLLAETPKEIPPP